MRKVILFIAMSLDGFIADKDGGVGWLAGQDSGIEGEDSYASFEKEVDAVIMGWTTYHQIVTELSPGKWVYEQMQSYVITHRECPSASNITFLSENPCRIVDELRHKEGKGIWICGGADIVHQLMQENMIDRYHISIIPTLLGGGIRLFGSVEKEIPLRLVMSKSDNGIMELIYDKR